MYHDLQESGGQEPARINVGQPHEVRYWTQELGVGADKLWAAVIAVGPSAEAVREYLEARMRRPH